MAAVVAMVAVASVSGGRGGGFDGGHAIGDQRWW